jgi:tRNA A-37 threonylcarbamoyl transferase component Bud32
MLGDKRIMKKVTAIGLGTPVVEDMTSEELALKQAEEKAWNDGALDRALNNLRTKRNTLLAKTDWTSSSDLTMSDDMKTYRQQLRDATTGLDTVEKVEAYTFPTEVLK